MDTREYFNYVVVPNYNEFVRRPTDFHLLWNPLVSMNTVAEHLGLHQREYGQVSRAMSFIKRRKGYVVNLTVSKT
jgi:hypothetical protein